MLLWHGTSLSKNISVIGTTHPGDPIIDTHSFIGCHPNRGIYQGKAYSSAIMDDLASVVANVVEPSSWEKSRRGHKCRFPPKGRTSPHVRRCIPWNASRNSKLVLCVQVAIAFIQENLRCSSGVSDCGADTSGAFNEPQEMRQHESQKVQAAQLFTQGYVQKSCVLEYTMLIDRLYQEQYCCLQWG
jgi:hypothetical protein